MQGTVIEATLTTGINSSLSGTITSTVSYDIWSADMRQVLIPRGSQMFGRYSSEVALGQERVLVAWDRVVTPDFQVVDLEAYGSDRLGRSGLTGNVNNRFGQRFGAAAAVSVFSALPALAASRSEDEATSEIAEQVGTDARDATSSVVEKYLDLAPIITVEHGDVIMVMVTNDLELF
jgi:type IV secretion system protein VirB10